MEYFWFASALLLGAFLGSTIVLHVFHLSAAAMFAKLAQINQTREVTEEDWFAAWKETLGKLP